MRSHLPTAHVFIPRSHWHLSLWMRRNTRLIDSIRRVAMSSSNRPVTTAVPPKSAESAPPPQWSSREYAWPVSARQATSTSETAPGVDAFLLSNVGHPRYAADPAFEHAKQRATDAGLPAIAVSALFGQYLAITAKAMKAERIIEIGTLGGYSTGFLANALPSHGTIDTIEISPEHAKIAQRNFLDMDLFPFPTTHVGPALDVLRRPEFEEGAYDLIFVDADKAGLPEYLIESLRLLRPGGLGVFDNTVRAGRVAEEEKGDPHVEGVKRFYKLIKDDGGRKILATTIQTVGEKGWDGFTLVYKQEEPTR